MNLNLTSAMGSYLNNGSNSSDILNRLASRTKENDNADILAELNIDNNLKTDHRSLSVSLNNSNDNIILLNKVNKSMDDLMSILDTIKEKSISLGIGEASKEEEGLLKEELISLINKYDSVILNTEYKKQYPLKNNGEPMVFSIGLENENSIEVKFQSILSKDLGFEKPYVLGNFAKGFVDEKLNGTIEPYKLTIDLEKEGKKETKELILPLPEKDKANLQLQASILLAVVNQAISVITQNQNNTSNGSKQLEALTKNILNLRANVKNALSSLSSLDYGNESAVFSKLSILSKSGSLILAQANSVVKENIQNLVA